ncbi:MAG TPA: flagellar protein FlgN [Rhodocyclaceae bacterium]|nr:flagellar protein FlgN [Rhodocyclaceae bacterium]
MSELIEILDNELAELQRFCALLIEEQKVLTGRKADRLPIVAADKAALAAKLNQLEKQREATLAGCGFSGDREGMRAWLAAGDKPEEANSRWDEILRLAERARSTNDANGRLIGLLLKQNQDALSVLLAGSGDSIYGANGQQFSRASKRSIGMA